MYKYLLFLCVLTMSCGVRQEPNKFKLNDILDTGIVIDHGDYVEVQFGNVTVFTSKSKTPFVNGSGSNDCGENGLGNAHLINEVTIYSLYYDCLISNFEKARGDIIIYQ